MRTADAPRPGWYPDPENRTRLRWWDGLDWTEARRAPPSVAELDRSAAAAHAAPGQFPQGQTIEELRSAMAAASRADRQQVIEDVRTAARAEMDRAAQQFGDRAQNVVRSVTPLIDTYTSRFTRMLKLAASLALLITIAWFTFQSIAQASFFEWIGDRIDNIFDNDEEGGQAEAGIDASGDDATGEAGEDATDDTIGDSVPVTTAGVLAEVPLLALLAGDCIKPNTVKGYVEGTKRARPTIFPVVVCDAPHEAEVILADPGFFSERVDLSPVEIRRMSKSICKEAFPEYTGEDPGYESNWPTFVSPGGDSAQTALTCLAVHWNKSRTEVTPTTGSLGNA